MEFQFDANQTYQLEAIAAITALFDGQRPNTATFTLAQADHAAAAAVANRLDITAADLLTNLHRVQTANNITPDPELYQVTGTSESAGHLQAIMQPPDGFIPFVFFIMGMMGFIIDDQNRAATFEDALLKGFNGIGIGRGFGAKHQGHDVGFVAAAPNVIPFIQLLNVSHIQSTLRAGPFTVAPHITIKVPKDF